MTEPTKIEKSIAETGIRVSPPILDPALGDGKASFDKGFGLLNFTPVESGGIPPWGQDMNGFLFALSDVIKHYCSGGLFSYDAAYQTEIGGYPINSILKKSNGMGLWLSTVDNNVTDPDSAGAGWVTIRPDFFAVATGSTSAYTADYNPDITELVDGLVVTLDTTSVGTNTVIAPTFSPNGLTTRTIVKNKGDLVIGDLPKCAMLQYKLSTTQWVLLNPLNPETGVISLSALDFPTFDTPDNRITVTPASATNGGTVSIPADVLLSLAEEFTNGENGIMRFVKTLVYTSADLDINSTYYLRFQFIAGVFTAYTTKGSDSDTIPASLKGTVDGSSGGFDSSQIDGLVCKIVTGGVGSTPSVTELANNKRLYADFSEQKSLSQNLSWASLKNLTIDFARNPNSHITLMGFKNNSTTIGGGAAGQASAAIRGLAHQIDSSSRYSISSEYTYEDSGGDSGKLLYKIIAEI